MPHAFLQILIYPKSPQIEAQHAGTRRCSPGRTELCIEAFYPGLTE